MTTAPTHREPKAISIGPSLTIATPFGSIPPTQPTIQIVASAIARRTYDRSKADYTDAIRLGTCACILNARALSYAAKNDHDHAIADYNEAIRIDPKYALAYDNRGDAYKAKGDLRRLRRRHSAQPHQHDVLLGSRQMLTMRRVTTNTPSPTTPM
jgi:hypothetical protein